MMHMSLLLLLLRIAFVSTVNEWQNLYYFCGNGGDRPIYHC